MIEMVQFGKMELKTLEEVGNDLGIKPSTLRTWISEYRVLGDPDSLPRVREYPDSPLEGRQVIALGEKELLRLRRIKTRKGLFNLKNSQTVQLLDDLENKGSPSIVKVLENRREDIINKIEELQEDLTLIEDELNNLRPNE